MVSRLTEILSRLYVFVLLKCKYRSEQYLHVQHEIIGLAVSDVQLFALFCRPLTAFASLFYLPQSGESSGRHEAVDTGIGGQLLCFVKGEGAIAHYGHVAFQNIEELWKLINAVFADDSAYLGDTRVVFYLDEGILILILALLVEVILGYDEIIAYEHHLIIAYHHIIIYHAVGNGCSFCLVTQWHGLGFLVFLRILIHRAAQFLETAVGIRIHAAELEEIKDCIVGTYTLALEDDRTLAFPFDGQCRNEEDGGQTDDGYQRERDIKKSLPHGYLKLQNAMGGSGIIKEDILTV